MMRGGRVVLIIQARMGSTRLPGKSLMLLAGAPLIQRIIERTKRANRLDMIVLATTERPEDNPLMNIAGESGVAAFRGSESDLVERYYQAALVHKADIVVRLPGDNPVVEPGEIDRIITHYLISDDDFSSNTHNILDNGYPDGLGVEVFSFEKLREIRSLTVDPRNREHPHTYFYEHPELYRIGTVLCPKEFRRPDLVLDVNTKPQFDFIAELYARLYARNPQFHICDIIRWYDEEYLPVTKVVPPWFHEK